MWRYTSVVDIFNIAKANAFGTLAVVAAIGYSRGYQDIPRAVFVIDLILTFGFTSFSRLAIRLIYSHLMNPKPYRIEISKRVLLIGAGTTGEFICKELLNDSIHRMEPVGFLDKRIHGRYIHGKEVLGKVNDLEEFVTEYDEALICCPNAPRKDLYRIIEICKNAGKPFRTLPSVDEVVSGRDLFGAHWDSKLTLHRIQLRILLNH
jgi:FlaA1/EpsC-like NDP-sugar epimerase